VGGYRLDGVLGTRRHEPARRRAIEPGRLIQTDRSDEKRARDRRDPFHPSSPLTRRIVSITRPLSSSKRISTTPRPRPIRYVPKASSGEISAAITRSRRRQRLRTTAPPTCRPIAYATNTSLRPSSDGTKCTVTGPLRDCRLLVASAANVFRPRTGPGRPVKPTGAPARGGDGPARPRVRHESTCADGNRAVWPSWLCLAETSAS